MRCPTCRADNAPGSYVCHSCLRPLPVNEGEDAPSIISTGRLPRATDRFVRQPSEWTTPLQVTAAGYMLLSAVGSLLALALGHDQFTRAFVVSATAHGSTMTIDQLNATAGISYNGVLVVTAFVADMVLLALAALSSVGTILLVPSLGAGAALIGPGLVTLVLDLAGICLFAWMAVAVSRYGIWACRKIPVAH